MRNRQTGVALIEFALVLPLLLILTLLTTEFGRAMYQYNTIVKAVRDASRYLSVQDPAIASYAPEKVLVARRLVVYGTPEAGSASIVPRLELANVPDPIWKQYGSSPLINTVTISVIGYKFRPLSSSLFGIVFGNANGEIPFGEISATMRTQS